MSATTIIADLEAELANVGPLTKSFLMALTARVSSMEAAFGNLGASAAAALADATTDVENALGAGATIAAAATNPATLAVAIGQAAVPVTTLFQNAFNLAEGFVEGLEGKTPAAGASQAEVDGDAAGAGVKNFFDAFVETLVDPLLGKSPAPATPAASVPPAPPTTS